MDNYVEVGKIVNSFGTKGEVKIISDFVYKDRVFVKDYPLYIGSTKVKEVISTHRVHKNYDLVCFEGYSNINEILKYKGKNIYTLRSDLNLKDNEYLIGDLIGFKVFDDNKEIGIVIDYIKEVNNYLLKVQGSKSFYLPLISNYIKEVIAKDRKIITNKGSDLIL